MLEGSTSVEDAREKRTKNIRLTIITSIFSKVFGVGTQFLALPIAERTLGSGFQLFAVLAVLGSVLGVVNLGHGPGITMQLTKFASNPDKAIESSWMSSAIFVSLASTVVVVILAAIVGLIYPMPTLFGDTIAPLSDQMKVGYFTFVGLVAIQNFMSTFTFAYEGYLEAYKPRLVAMIGYGLSIPVSLAVCFWMPNAVGVILALHGIPILMQTLNMYRLLIKDRPYLKPEISALDKSKVKRLFGSNVLFSLAASGNIMTRQGTVLIVAKLGPLGSPATAAILLSWFVMCEALYVMITGSTWPSFSNAVKSNDWPWIKRGLTKMMGALLIIGFSAGLTITLTGVPVGNLLYSGKQVNITQELATYLGLVALLGAFEVGVAQLLLAYDRLKTSATVSVIQGVIALAVGVPLIRANGLAGMLQTMIISFAAMILIGGVILGKAILLGRTNFRIESNSSL